MNCRQALAEHERLLRTIVFARVREAEAVDEVMQEVALAAVRASAPPADGAKVGPSLYRVRQALLYRRKWGRMRTSETDYATSKFAERHNLGATVHRTWIYRPGESPIC